MIAPFEVLEQAFIVAMNPSESVAVDFEIAERLVERRTTVLDGEPEAVAIRVAVPPNEVRCKALEKSNGFIVFDVAAVQNDVHVALAKLP